MTAFVWADRDGRPQELDSPALIEAEAEAIAQEIDRCVTIIDGGDSRLRNPARDEIGNLQPRLVQLRADLARWNSHAIAANRAEAAKFADQIDRLPAMIADVVLVVELHAEEARFWTMASNTPELSELMLAEPMTEIQRSAIAGCASLTAPTDPVTRGEAKEWLDQQPRFARSGQVDSGWFGWVDRNGHAHRLSDPLTIEREVVAIAKELLALRLTLVGAAGADTLYQAVDAGRASWARLSDLKRDLERYDREATAREDAAWTAYAADWRSKRKTT